MPSLTKELKGGINMKVYERYENNKYYYPEDMKTIIDYLNTRGRILVKENTIENLYHVFSYEYYGVVWMSIYGGVLEKFEEWLTNYEI